MISLFAVLGTAVGVAESYFPLPFPGVRLGIANVFSLLALLFIGAWESAAVASLRLCVTLLLTGNVFAASCSAGGLVCSLPLSILLYKKFGGSLSVRAISVASAEAFNVGQIAVVAAATSEPAILAYLPVILAAGAATGYVVGRLAEKLNERLEKFSKPIH